MKSTTIIAVLVSGLLVLSIASGCAKAPAVGREAGPVLEEAGPLLMKAAKSAAGYTDDVLRLRQAARNAENPEEIANFLRQAEEAAQGAQRAGEEAQSAGRRIEGLQSQRELFEEFLQAQRSAEIARIWSSMDDISNDIIIQRGIQIESGPEQDRVKVALQSVISASICDALVETLNNNGQSPDKQKVVQNLLENLQRAAITLSGLDDIAQDILLKVEDVVLEKPPDELAIYKEACQRGLGE